MRDPGRGHPPRIDRQRGYPCSSMIRSYRSFEMCSSPAFFIACYELGDACSTLAGTRGRKLAALRELAKVPEACLHLDGAVTVGP